MSTIKMSSFRKIKNKLMFSELKTHEQNKIERVDRRVEVFDDDSGMGVEDDEILMGDDGVKMKTSQEMQKICCVVNQMMLKNKISYRNAFQVPLIDLQYLQQFKELSDMKGYGNGWQKLSYVLENDMKIYSYRIDALHLIAYKMLNFMVLNENRISRKSVENSVQERNLGFQGESGFYRKMVENKDDGVIGDGFMIHLQKYVENLNIRNFEGMIEFDPNYERTRRKFDENGFKGLLLNNVDFVGVGLCLDKNGFVNMMKYERDMGENFVFEETREKLQICDRIENERKKVLKMFGEEYRKGQGYSKSWQRIKKGDFGFEWEEGQVFSDELVEDGMMDECEGQREEYKEIQKMVKMKNMKKKVLRSQRDVINDGIRWLSQTDKMMLGLLQDSMVLKKRQVNMKMVVKDDEMDFMDILVQKDEIFYEGIMENKKILYNETIEQKNLLPMKPFEKFRIEELMCLRSEPIQKVFQGIEDERFVVVNERQIDMKRQQMSIRESKQKLKLMIRNGSDFGVLFDNFKIEEKEISAELCFLTMLHLANQNCYLFEQSNDETFKIRF